MYHHYSHNGDPLMHTLLGLGFGGFLFYKGMRTWLQKREIQNKPLSRIQSIAMGDAEISGLVKTEATIKSPFSDREAVYCRYTVEEPNKNGWRMVEHGEQHCVFYVDDGSGRILMNPEGAQFYGSHTFQTIVNGSGAVQSPGIAAWLLQRQQKSILGRLAVAGRHRFTEYLICPEQIVFVEGVVGKARHVVQGVEREENIIGRRSSGHFILSAYSEERLLSQLAWSAPLQIAGGMVLMLGCLWYLAERFQLERFLK